MSSVLADISPLRELPDFRRLWSGQLVSAIGAQITQVATAIQIYDLTGSSFSVGLIGICSLVPLIIFGLLGGAIADTMDRRRLGLMSAAGLAAMSVLLAAQAVAHLDQAWLLYVAVAVQSAFFALNNPARSAMIPRLVPAGQLPAANALNSLSMTLAMTLGPMLGGLLIGLWGFQAAYLFDVATFSASLYAMWRLPAMPPEREEGADPAKRASVREGLRFLKDKPNVKMTFLQDIVAMVFGMPRALFPALAIGMYGGGSGTVGLLTSAIAVGATIGALFSGRLGGVRFQGRAVTLAVVVWGVAIICFGLTTQLWLGLVCLAVAGAADTISMIFRNTIMQVATPDHMRGRLSGVFLVVVAGGPRLGDFESGTAAAAGGLRFAVVSGGVLCLVGVLVLSLCFKQFWKYDALDPKP